MQLSGWYLGPWIYNFSFKNLSFLFHLQYHTQIKWNVAFAYTKSKTYYCTLFGCYLHDVHILWTHLKKITSLIFKIVMMQLWGLPKRGNIVKTQTKNQNDVIDVKNPTSHQPSNHKNWILVYNMSSNSIIFKGMFYVIFPHAIKTNKTWSIFPF